MARDGARAVCALCNHELWTEGWRLVRVTESNLSLHVRAQRAADMHGNGNLDVHPLRRTERGDMQLSGHGYGKYPVILHLR